jgi:hypothetical protein
VVEEVSHRVKYWVRPDIINRIKEGSIKAYFNSNLEAIRETEVDIQTPEGLDHHSQRFCNGDDRLQTKFRSF